MRHCREYYLRMRNEHGLIRYMICDSSRQHDREFEAVYFFTLLKTQLAQGMIDANELINLQAAAAAVVVVVVVVVVLAVAVVVDVVAVVEVVAIVTISIMMVGM